MSQNSDIPFYRGAYRAEEKPTGKVGFEGEKIYEKIYVKILVSCFV
jgi:hypothetical protein